MSRKTQALEKLVEPYVEMRLPDFMSSEEMFRKRWAESGADFAYFVVKFLQGRRRREIQPSEIVKTLIYQRSNDVEKSALLLVCDEPRKGAQPSWEDERMLKERDLWLSEYIDGKNLGHADLVAELNAIPKQVAERQEFDKYYFRTVYEPRKLFSWLWKGNNNGN